MIQRLVEQALAVLQWRPVAVQADQLAQVERLVSLGARRVDWDYPEDADFVVLADPDGNLFCVIA